jgi:hypothetical protein
MSNPTDALLEERGRTHGDFTEHALIAQALKRAMQRRTGWARLNHCSQGAWSGADCGRRESGLQFDAQERAFRSTFTLSQQWPLFSAPLCNRGIP